MKNFWLTRRTLTETLCLGALALWVNGCSSTHFAASNSGSKSEQAAGTGDGSSAANCPAGQTCNGIDGASNAKGGAGSPGSAASGGGATSGAGAGSVGGGATTLPKACVSGDKVNVAWTGDVKACLVDQGKTYNFESSTCTAMRQATFTCDWSTVQAQLTQRGLLTDTIKNDAANGAKLVTCGQSQDGHRIVVQWIRSNNSGVGDNCSAGQPSSYIMTGCYRDDKIETWTTEDQRRSLVFACMNSL